MSDTYYVKTFGGLEITVITLKMEEIKDEQIYIE